MRSLLRLPVFFGMLLVTLSPLHAGSRIEIGVPGFRFDPVVDGEPAIPSDLRADDRGPRLRLVQFTGPVRGEWLAELEARGVRPLQYYPHQTYLVWADSKAAAALASLPFVRWHGLFHPAYKINTDLAALDGPIDSVEALYYADTGERTADALAALTGGLVSDRKAQPDGAFRSAMLVTDADRLADLARLDTVLWLGYRRPRPVLEDEMASQIVAGNYAGGVPFVGYFSHLASLGVDGTGVQWAVIDTGLDYDHPDIGPRIYDGFTFPGANCGPPTFPPGSDCGTGKHDSGHGTHVGGIVGADATAGFTDANGFLYGLGVAPGVSLFAMNIFADEGDLPDYPRVALTGGAVGANNSWAWGGPGHGYQSTERTMDFLVRDGNMDTAGVAEPFIEVFSAGNSGPDPSTITEPKEAKNLIVVGNSLNFRAGDIDTINVLSSRGPALDGRWQPTVTAPGQVVASTRNDLGGSSCANAIGGTDSLYAFCQGTSMASPQVAGAVVLVVEWWRTLFSVVPSPAIVRALLVNAAVDMGTPDIPNNNEGWGRAQVTNIIKPTVATLYFDQTTTFHDPADEWTLDVTVDDPGQPLRITLAWSDAPGAPGASPALVNDLDLTVVTDGQTYRGNVFSAGVSVTGGTADALNNLENVFVPAPGSTASITVHATAVNGDGVPFSGDTTDQDFVLVCSNCLGSEIFADGFESGNTSAWTTTAN